ncbi:MAG: Eco57I restriction-modification methylase domain-containing protein [Planctomycetota bacterium]
MLFARFLAENGLLIEPQAKMTISLAEAEELAKEDGVDVWMFASRCAQDMLPQIFRPEDPLLQVSFANEHCVKLEGLLESLPQAVFTASDALGWVYQFWQSKRKDEVTRSGVKIGAEEISAVTQLFTEPYMVQFLLHNTLGAWWAGKKLAAMNGDSAKTEDELRRTLALPGVGWDYIRFIHGEEGKGGPWRLAAGTFEGWPKTASELKVLDPCCGSGHFLVAALHLLVPIRIAEEGLLAREAVDAVLSDNLHGLEIDERCCQIAAFALAFAAWIYPDAGGYRPLPDLHIACTGIGPQSTQEQWLKLAEQSSIPMPTVGREAIENGLLNLHRLFSQASTLGSLINPGELPADLIAADYETIHPYLAAILKAEKSDDETRARAIAADGMVKAAELLAGKYTIVVTNVPYLGRKLHSNQLAVHADSYHRDARSDLATIFVSRLIGNLAKGGALGLVTPQNWLFLKTYRDLRRRLLKDYRWNMVAKLGPAAFQDMNWWAANTMLLIMSVEKVTEGALLVGVDASATRDPLMKGLLLAESPLNTPRQSTQLRNPDTRVTFEEFYTPDTPLLEQYADCLQGVSPTDQSLFVHQFWEHPRTSDEWSLLMGSFPDIAFYSGREQLLRLPHLEQVCRRYRAAIRGKSSWGHSAVLVRQMRHLPATISTGEPFDANVACVLPKDPRNLLSIWAFCSSSSFHPTVRRIDQKTQVTNATLGKIPFDLTHWQKVAAEKYPDGLPEPESDDPTQWIFHGRPEESTAPLQAAMARLLGYSWPAELDDKMRLSARARTLVKRCEELAKFADDDGIVCIPSVRGEEPAAEQLQALLVAAGIKPAQVRELAGGVDLDEWLRNSFFEEHCKLFHNRPFLWHIWDGRKRDGFHTLVNYHKLCEGGGKGRKLLESLTYSYLGEWITRQKDGVKRGEGGAEDRLAAAVELKKRLEAILAGEPPFDLFVRWKPLSEQPIGWEPDINDGVRVNIRPFLASDLHGGRTGAGILRFKPNTKWTKDRGKEPERPKVEYPWFWNWDEKTEDFTGGKKFDGKRWNDCHYTNKAKQAVREVAKAKEGRK